MVRNGERYKREFDDGEVIIEIQSTAGIEIDCEVVESEADGYSEGDRLSMTSGEITGNYKRVSVAQ